MASLPHWPSILVILLYLDMPELTKTGQLCALSYTSSLNCGLRNLRTWTLYTVTWLKHTLLFPTVHRSVESYWMKVSTEPSRVSFAWVHLASVSHDPGKSEISHRALWCLHFVMLKVQTLRHWSTVRMGTFSILTVRPSSHLLGSEDEADVTEELNFSF